ncbi:MAG TPA: hypothetical protein VJK03_01000 [Candidatus Nanoarchaeia archaeon]|nr:hypothetical protein [Candidatus Nanoarchaeia archaeon]
MAAPTLFSSDLAQAVLVFLLVFVASFAILQKSRIFGEGKKQIDALVALTIGLIAVSVGYATDIISSLIPFMAVAIVIILIFMILLGTLYKEDKFDVPGWLKGGFGILIFIAVVIAVLYSTGAWDSLYELFAGDESSGLVANVIFIVIIIAVIGAVIWGSGKGKSDKKD